MADDRQNRTHLRSSVTLGSQSPMKDTGFSSKTRYPNRNFSLNIFLLIAMQLVSTTPLLPTTMSPQQSIEESAVLRSLRMNALQVSRDETNQMTVKNKSNFSV